MSVQVESYRSSNPAQCFKCQRFGHSSLYCGYAPRCVKCAENHLAQDCPLSKEASPKCINCSGDHTANYKKCPALLKIKAEKIPRRLQNSSPSTSFPPLTTTTTTSTPPEAATSSNQTPQTHHISYANATAANSSSQNQKISTIVSQLNALLTKITSDEINIKDALLTMITTILPIILKNDFH